MDLQDLRTITTSHDVFWDRIRMEMRAYTRVYRTRMWDDGDRKNRPTNMPLVETADGYGYIESYVASLFARRPAVAVSAGPDETGDPALAEGLANRFLYKQVDVVEDLVRFSLIYPYCGVKLGFIDRPKVIDQIDIQVVMPWDMIVDMDAPRWELQRYVGHRYYMPLPSAVAKWGRKRWKASIRTDYLEQRQLPTGQASIEEKREREAARTMVSSTQAKGGRSASLSYVEIFEVYDLVGDERVIWSPSLDTQDGVVERCQIPVRSPDGSPLPPIFALYMSHDPQVPLRGASALGRVYDQLYEINQLRTYWANAVRRDSRMYMARKGVLDEQSKATLSANLDQSVVEIELPMDQALSGAIQPIPSPTISSDFDRYYRDVRDDLNRGSIMAPFTRGQATSATATEVAAMTQYTSSEIGRMARRRDLIVESVAECYNRMLFTLLSDDEAEKEIVTIDGKAQTLSADALAGSMRYAAADQSSTPLSSAIRRQRMLELVPLLERLGVSKDKILENIVREFDLPQAFIEKPKPAQSIAPGPLPEDGTVPLADLGPSPLPVGGGVVAQGIRDMAQADLEAGDGDSATQGIPM